MSGVASDERIDLRIGINVGDVVVENADIFGDGVNVAARLEEFSAPGGFVYQRAYMRTLRGDCPCASSISAINDSRTSLALFESLLSPQKRFQRCRKLNSHG